MQACGPESVGADDERLRAAFLKGLADPGYVEGHNVAIEYRWVAGQNENLPAILHDLIDERRVAVLASTGSTAMAVAAKAATHTTPIVFRIGGDPVATGLVSSLSMPGGSVTGTTTLGVELGPKRLEVLSELLPAGATVARSPIPAMPMPSPRQERFKLRPPFSGCACWS